MHSSHTNHETAYSGDPNSHTSPVYVEIDHGNGLTSYYGHLSTIATAVGRRVSKGDLIARTGNTGSSTGPHLHFGVHKHGSPRNPADFLS